MRFTKQLNASASGQCDQMVIPASLHGTIGMCNSALTSKPLESVWQDFSPTNPSRQDRYALWQNEPDCQGLPCLLDHSHCLGSF